MFCKKSIPPKMPFDNTTIWSWVILGVAIVVILTLFFCKTGSIITGKKELYYSLVGVMAVFTVFINMINRQNHFTWEKKKATGEYLKDFRDAASVNAFMKLPLNYKTRIEPISVDEIHDLICQKNEKGEFITDPSTRSSRYVFNNNGSEIIEVIWNFLGRYEYLATALKSGYFDKTMIYKLQCGNIIRVYKMFGPYVKHYNEVCYPERNGKVWCNLMELGEEYSRFRS